MNDILPILCVRASHEILPGKTLPELCEIQHAVLDSAGRSIIAFRFVINKILVFMQARDEKGIWKDIMSAEELENKSYASVRKMKAFEQINLVVKVPQGDFETDIRYKLLVNAPPNYPIDLFIYSNSFKGRISESSLSKK